MPNRIVIPFALLATLLALVVAGLPIQSRAQEGSNRPCASETELVMVERINALREENGLEPLALSRPLGAAAEEKATEMAEQDYLAHESPDGRELRALLESVGYTFNTAVGENIAAGQESADATFEQWLNSPEHKEIMLGEQFTAVGIARAYNADAEYDWYWAAEFGGEVGEAAEPCAATPEPEAAASPAATPQRLVCDVLSRDSDRLELSCRDAG